MRGPHPSANRPKKPRRFCLTLRNAWSSSFCKSAKETSKILPFNASFAFLRQVGRLTSVFPTSLIWKDEGALTWYQSLRVKGSKVFFLRPFFPFERRLFFPTAMIAISYLVAGLLL